VARCPSDVDTRAWRAFDSGVEAGKEVGFAGKGFGAKAFRVGCIKVEFVAVDHEGDPAQHTGDEGGEIAKFH
jgi:hypothetical protein